MNNDGRAFNLANWNKGDPLRAGHLQESVNVLRAMNQGAQLGITLTSDDYNADFPSQYKKCQLLLTDAAYSLSGVSVQIEGKTPSGYVIRATGGAPGSDGIYLPSSGAWLMIARLSYSQSGTGPVIPNGTQFTVYDGTSVGSVYCASNGAFVKVTGGSAFTIAFVATTANITNPSGSQTIDGATINTDGVLVLFKNQSSGANGIYSSKASGAWTFINKPSIVFTQGGTVGGLLTYIFTSPNTYTAMGAAYT